MNGTHSEVEYYKQKLLAPRFVVVYLVIANAALIFTIIGVGMNLGEGL